MPETTQTQTFEPDKTNGSTNYSVVISDKDILDICEKRIEHMKKNYISVLDYIVILKYLSGQWFFDLQKGKIYSTATKKELYVLTQKNGYSYIHTYFMGDSYNIPVHRAIAIIGNGIYNLPNMTMEVDHINGIRTDNRLENLRIITVKENRSSHKIPKEHEELICEMANSGVKYDDIAKIIGCHHGSISRIARKNGIIRRDAKPITKSIFSESVLEQTKLTEEKTQGDEN